MSLHPVIPVSPRLQPSSAADEAATSVNAARAENWEIRAKIHTLRERLAVAEGHIALLGNAARAMPDDFGDWTHSGPRVHGLAVRVHQTYVQSLALAGEVQREKERVSAEEGKIRA